MIGSLWGGKICLHTFLAVCFTRGMHVQFVFTTRFEMLSVFISGQEVVVSSGGAPTPAGTSMFTIWKICTHMKCEVKHNRDMGMGHLWYNGWGIYDLSMWLWQWVGQLWQSKLLFCLEIYSKKCWSSGEYPFRSSHDHRFCQPDADHYTLSLFL